MEFSILDIAQKAGVSKSTISRVINGGSVSPKTRKIVEDTMREMGYSPNYMARGLRGVHNTVVGILSLGSSMFSHPSISRRIAGILVFAAVFLLFACIAYFVVSSTTH